MPSSDSTTRFNLIHRLPQLLLFAALMAWSLVASAVATSAANGLAFRLRLVEGRQLLEVCFRLFLLVLGFVALQGMARQRETLGEVTALPRRPTAGQEWLTGAALGWGIVVATVIPLVFFAHFHARFVFGATEVTATVLALATTGAATLGHEMTFRGYPFRCLTRVLGPSAATVLMVIGAGLLAWYHASISESGIVASMLLTFLLLLSWLRTHAIWLAWGLHFALVASATVLLGLPVERGVIVPTIIRSRVYGPSWLTGGGTGPLGTIFASVVLFGAVIVLYRLTRDYAWSYTHKPILAAGAEVVVAPPAAHAAMEQQAAAPALVQILASTPMTFSAVPPPPD